MEDDGEGFIEDPLAEFARLPPGPRDRILRELSVGQKLELLARWSRWAHGGQHAPDGDDWRVWLIRAGRGFGKTRAGSEWVNATAHATPGAQIALVGASLAEARRIMVDGPDGVIATAWDGDVTWFPTAGQVRWENGAVAHVYSADAPDTLRGPGHHAAWCDELAKWRRGEAAWSNLTMTMRMGDFPRIVVTTTPRPTRLMRRVMALKGTKETLGRSHDNPHLPASFLEAMIADYGGTRLGRQEIDGEMLDDVAGALWTRATIEACRESEPERFTRVVVGVDPPAGVGHDACGIVAVGKGADGRAYVIEDASVVGTTPEGWARAVAECAARVGADRVIAEANQGGAMVKSTLLAADAGLPVTLVHAARGKVARAEPVALLYENGKARHAGVFPALEDELCGLAIGGGYEGPGRSPDRADALVWAMTALMLGGKGEAGVRGL